MSPGQEMLAAHMREQGHSEAWIAYRCRDDKPRWPEPTVAGMHDEAAKWPGRIKSFDAVQNENGVEVRLERHGGRVPWQCRLDLGNHARFMKPEHRERRIRDFCMMQIVNIEKLGNPRWDALVAEESAR